MRSGFHFHSKKLFIGGESQETNEEDVRTYFLQFGNVSTAIVFFTPLLL